MSIRNQRGQALIEYILLIGLVGAASIFMVTKLQHTIKVNLSRTIWALQGKGAGERGDYAPVRQSDLSRRDFSDFWKDSHTPSNGSARGGDAN